MTIAERIIEHVFDGDGAHPYTSRQRIDRDAFLDRVAFYRPRDTGADGAWEFRDGSRITQWGGGIDTPEGWEAAR